MRLIDADKLIEKLSTNLDNPEEFPVISLGTIMRMIADEDEVHPPQPESPCYLGSPCEYQNPNAEIQEECKLDGTTAVAKSKRTFVELLVHYPHPDVCTYPEYKGKPYYSIKYIEDGECFVGFGTYKLEVLSQYLRDYFMPSAQPEPERTMEEFMYGQDMGNPEDGSL